MLEPNGTPTPKLTHLYSNIWQVGEGYYIPQIGGKIQTSLGESKISKNILSSQELDEQKENYPWGGGQGCGCGMGEVGGWVCVRGGEV